MKRLLAAFALLFIIPGCVSIEVGQEAVRGKGEIKTCDYEVGEFGAVRVIGDFEIAYRYSETCSVSAEMQENLYKYVSVSDEDGVLTVQSGVKPILSNGRKVKVTVKCPEITAIESSGTVLMKDCEFLNGESLLIDVSGTCDIDISVGVKDFNVSVSGAGNIKVSGTSEKAAFELSGAGNIDGIGLKTKECYVDISGAGSGSISCSDYLSVDISGAGSFRYRGDPKIDKDISGIGSLEKE